MKDHYQYIDPSLSIYNFLRYRPGVWRLLNPGLQWQSRLRHPQYLELFRNAGFLIVTDTPNQPTTDELRQLAALPVAAQFRSFDIDELAIKSTHLVAAPRGRTTV